MPWCTKKCPYCDFNSHAIEKSDIPEKLYIEALIRDLDSELPLICERPIVSIFIGGGTPSLFSTAGINRLMSALQARLNLYRHIEITLEANPNSAEARLFKDYYNAGINRLSLGIQSFDNEKLMLLGRTHNGDDARHAIDIAGDAGFEQINIDIMFGLPQQNISAALNDLAIAMEQNITHLSWYQLTIEPNTVFYKKRPVLQDEEAHWQMQQQGQQYLASRSFQQYEISAYARNLQQADKNQCQHNLGYWQFGDYLGLGAGAHGKLSHIYSGEIKRYVRHRIPQSYIASVDNSCAVVKCDTLTKDELPLEFMMNALRLNRGFHPAMFTERTGLPISMIQTTLATAVAKNWLNYNEENIRPTPKGRQYLNNVLELFMQ